MSRELIAWIILSSIWGSTWLFVKIGVAEIPPFTFAWLRFAVALIPLLVIMVLKKHKLPNNRRDWLIAFLSGLTYFSFNYGLVYWGEVYISSALAAILYTNLPLFGLVLAHFTVPNDRITLPKLAGVILGVVGVCLIFLDQIDLGQPNAVKGALAIVGATVSTAIGGVIVKLHARHFSSITLTVSQIVTGGAPLMIIALIKEGSPFAASWRSSTVFGLLYLALVGTALTFVMLNWLTKHMDVTKTQLIPFGSTLIAVILGWLVLNETMQLRTFGGMVLILGGLACATLIRRSK